MLKQIPPELGEAATAMVRLCIQHDVGLSGFVFAAGKAPFVFHFGTLKEDLDMLRGVHEGLFDLLGNNSDRIQHKVVQKNDA